MGCFLPVFTKRKITNNESSMSYTSSSKKSSEISSSRELISASEFASLKAEIWCLKNSLSDSRSTIQNMQEVVTSIVHDKYELIEELNDAKVKNEELRKEIELERNLHAMQNKEYLSEISELKIKLSDNIRITENLSEAAVNLNHSLQKANKVIYKMSLMYLKLKNNSKN